MTEQEFDYWRESKPSGITYFTRFDVIPIMVDALFDNPPDTEFSVNELAEAAEISKKSVNDRVHILFELNVVQRAEQPDKFKLNWESDVTQALWELDTAVNAIKKRDEPLTVDIPDEDSLEFIHSMKVTGAAD